MKRLWGDAYHRCEDEGGAVGPQVPAIFLRVGDGIEYVEYLSRDRHDCGMFECSSWVSLGLSGTQDGEEMKDQQPREGNRRP